MCVAADIHFLFGALQRSAIDIDCENIINTISVNHAVMQLNQRSTPFLVDCVCICFVLSGMPLCQSSVLFFSTYSFVWLVLFFLTSIGFLLLLLGYLISYTVLIVRQKANKTQSLHYLGDRLKFVYVRHPSHIVDFSSI